MQALVWGICGRGKGGDAPPMELMGFRAFPCLGSRVKAPRAGSPPCLPTLWGSPLQPVAPRSPSSCPLIWDLQKPARALGQLCREGPDFLPGLPGPWREQREVCRGIVSCC